MNVKTCSDGQAFVQVRNPWGNGAEWTGAYSDKSREWDRHPLHQRELRPEQREDGVFWMKWEDFRAVFTDIDVVEFFPYDDVVFSFFGAAPARDFVERNVFIVKADRPCHGVFTVAQVGLTHRRLSTLRVGWGYPLAQALPCPSMGARLTLVFLTAPFSCLLWALPCLSTGPRLTVVTS